jgi:hypothetical protein
MRLEKVLTASPREDIGNQPLIYTENANIENAYTGEK